MSAEQFPGYLYQANEGTAHDQLMFIIQQTLALVRTATLVKVKKVSTKDEVGPVGQVDVQPLVKMYDSLGNTTEHDTIHGLPYLRIQGGKNAIILDPKEGDIGIAVFADRDISTVKTQKDVAQPGSWRKFSFADGLYLGGVLNPKPEQYVRFFDKGIEVIDKNKNKIEMTDAGLKLTDAFGHIINMKQSRIEIAGDVVVTGTIKSTGDITARTAGGQVTVGTHKHAGVQTGGGTTAPPIPGS